MFTDMIKNRYLKIAQWNVNGIKGKLKYQDFVNSINCYDVCILTETWVTEKINIDNYYVECLPATKLKNKPGRYSGGVLVYIKKELGKIIKIVKDRKRNYGLWFKIDKSNLLNEKHLYIGAVYLPPIDSNYALNKPFECIENDICDLSENGNYILMGDFNARSAEMADYIKKYKGDDKTDINDHDSPEPDPRFNLDTEKNIYGKRLIELCKNTSVLILNGRTTGDIPANFTYHGTNGSSTVDYGLCNTALICDIVYFHVDTPGVWSDHCLTKLCVKLQQQKTHKTQDKNLFPLQENYKWSDVSSIDYCNALKSKVISDEITKVLNNSYKLNEKDTDQFCEEVTTIYRKAAKLSLVKKKHYNRRVNKSNTHESVEYNLLKKQLKGLGSLLQKDPRNPFLRGKFFHLKRNFRNILRKANKKYKEKMLGRIQELENKNPTAFWKLVNNIRGKKQNNEPIEPDIFQEYFKELHNGIDNKNLDLSFKKKLDNEIVKLAGAKWVEILDKSITFEELKLVTSSLKNKKACSFDSITNEMLKCSLNIMSNTLLKLFNHILHSELFPQQWSEGYINPIFKKGDYFDPANYRGITISSCIGKLFTKIINNRLVNFLIDNKIIPSNQIGFIPGKRTADHIFVLKTLMDQAKSHKKNLYMCFIDLKKAFDTVWTNGLLYKLSKINASTKFINLIKNMYNKVFSRIKTENGYTEFFKVTVGTRQGCNLSPALFNIYTYDLPEVLDKVNGNQPILLDKKVSCLLYADDIILLSYSSKGLQSLIDKTEQYCNKWQLTINVEKTKIIVAHKRTTDTAIFKVYNKTIEIVKSFCYLGIVITKNGSFKEAVSRLYCKSFRAYMSLKESFNFFNGTPPNIMEKLFETMVKPILLYGCEIWGISGWRTNEYNCIQNYMLKQNSKFESFHGKFCKHTLGLNKQTPEILAKAELGRYPLMGDIVKYTYSYWQYILSSDSNTLLYKALEANINMDRKGYTTYYSRFKGLLQFLDEKPKIYPICKSNVKVQANDIKTKYCKLYEKHFFNILDVKNQNTSAGKFEIYCKVKKVYRKELYLYNIKDPHLRRHITNLRCGSNRMPINWLRKYGINRNERLCTLCNKNQLGSEKHVIIECTNHNVNTYRNELFRLINNVTDQFTRLNLMQMFIYLIACNDLNIVYFFAVFLDKVDKLLKK